MQLSRLSKFIFISLLLCFSNAQASWWNKFVNALKSLITPITTPTYYFGDPNNPGINGGTTHTPNYMQILPPYNRKAGRGPTGREANCLYQYSIPGIGSNLYGVWTDICAQDPGNNSTKIKLRNVTCLGGCWAQTFELNGLKGECKFFAAQPPGTMQYILPIIARRVCARIASPEGDGYAADQGYMQGTDPVYGTRGQHLDTYGVTQWDELIEDQTGAKYSILRPKICAYDDPWLLDLWTLGDLNNIASSLGSDFTPSKLIETVWQIARGAPIWSLVSDIPLDFFDLNPMAQPFHAGSGVKSPVASILLSILQLMQSYSLAGPQMKEIVFSLVLSGMGLDSRSVKKVFGVVFEIINFSLNVQLATLIKILSANSQVNKYAYADYGCVNLPVGDYPPNYCPTSASIVSGLVDSICSTDANGNLYQNCYSATNTQTSQDTPYTLCSPIKCVQSNFDNNFLYNTVRIGYTHPVQACSGTVTSNCVNIPVALTRTSAMQNNNFVLGSALSLVKVGNIVISPTKQYRVLYQVLNSSMTNLMEVSNYFYVDLPDCGNTTNGYSAPSSMGSVVQSTQFCQSIWGVDVGEYSDSFNIRVDATTTAPTGPLSTSSSPVSIPYVDVYTGISSSNKFYIQIDQDTEDYDHICAYQTFPNTSYPDNKIDCIDRVDMPIPSVASCSTATHTSPCATVNWNVIGATGQNYNANATMRVQQFTSDWSSLPADPVLYLGGATFTTHVVDSNNLTINYQPTTSSDPHIVSYDGNILYNSMWGNYLNNIMPSSTCDQDTCSIYLNGLEYIGGHYVRGGSYLCIDNTKGCQNDTTQCILTNNYTALDGSTSWPSINPNDRIIPNTTSPSLTSSDYYTYDANTSSIPSDQNVRSKIGLENPDMCVTIPAVTCSDSADANTYYSDWLSGTRYYYKAIWPSARAGTLVSGSCISNYIPVDSTKMSRYCFLQSTGAINWDTNNSRVSSTFGGCMPGCIGNITVTPSDGSALTGGGNITVQNNLASTRSVDGGTLLIYSTGGAGSNGISGTGSNTMTINFTLPFTPSQADLYFTSLQFDDYIQIYVNGTEITTDSANIAYNGTNYPLWNSSASPTGVGGWRNYTTLDANLSKLNDGLLTNLRTGSNTITINVNTVSGGGFYIAMAYNQLCYTQCANDNAGSATWTQAAVGGISLGTCNAGYVALDTSKMTRYCALSSNAGVLDTVATGSYNVGISNNSQKGTSFAGCSSQACPTVTAASAATGYATWAGSVYGMSSAGTCMTNYIANDLNKMSRACTIINNTLDLEPIQANGTTASGNFAGCTLGTCAAVTTASSSSGYATWTGVNAGNSSTGTCAANYFPVDSSKMSRLCAVSNNVASLETIIGGDTDSGNFAGCLAPCITPTPTATATQLSLTVANSNSAIVTPNASGNGGTIVFKSYNMTATTTVGGLNAGTNDFTTTFNIPSGMTTSEAGIYFTNLRYNDYIQIYVNNNKITNDNNTINGAVLWSSTGSAVTADQNYQSLDPNFSNLNLLISSYLVSGQANTIKISVRSAGAGSGYLYASLAYNTTCYPKCSVNSTPSVTSGYATWTAAPVGAVATGTCGSGYSVVNTAKMARTCNFVVGSSLLETVSNGVSTNFAGCVTNCISATPTAASGTIVGTVTPNSSNTGGTIAFYKNPLAAGTGNTATVDFNIPTGVDLSKVGIYFTTLTYNDYIRVSVNGTQITNDNDKIYNNTYLLWSTTAGDVGPLLDYSTIDSGLAKLNAAILSNLRYGSNTITVTLRAYGAGTGVFTGNLTYNLGCMCTEDINPDITSGYATWTRSVVGGTSTATCGTGFTAINSSTMTRTCNLVNNSAQLDTITNGTSSNFTGCGCAAVTTSSSTTGYATWTSALPGNISTGTCASRYVAAGSMTRACTVQNGAATLDTITSGVSSNTNPTASFEGCLQDRPSLSTWYITNYGYTGCRLDLWASWSGSNYILTMNTCWGAGQNGIGSSADNDYRITFYVPSETSKQYVSMYRLKFNDYVRVYVSNASNANDSLYSATWTQVTTDSTLVSGYVLYKTSGDLPSWRDYANASGGIGGLTTAVRNALVAGKYNTVRVVMKTITAGGIDWGMYFYDPFTTFAGVGSKLTTIATTQQGW